jgi:LL-diaminopimelate aminotransferase
MTTASTAPDIKRLASQLWADSDEYIMFRIAKRVAELTPGLTEKGRKPLMMSIGAPTADPPKFFLDKFTEFVNEPGLHTYSNPRGEMYFRQAVAQRMKHRFGVEIDAAKEVCSLIGSKEGLAHMFRALITPRFEDKTRDVILTPDPGYASYVDAIERCGGKSFPIPLTPENQYMPNLEEVLAAAVAEGYQAERIKALIINYPSNPIGATCTMDYLRHVVEFARKHNILIISDLAYADMYFTGEEPPHSILEVPGAKDIAIEFHSLSKPYCLTGWRVGFAVGHRDAVDLLATVKSTVDSGLFKAIQKVAAFALTSPECDAFIADVNKTYEANQKIIVDGFRELGWPEAALNAPKATFYLWLPVPPRFASCEEFASKMLEVAGVVVVPGTGFGRNGEGYFRLSNVLPPAQLREVIDRMKSDGFAWNG